MRTKRIALTLLAALMGLAAWGCESNDIYIVDSTDTMAPATPRGAYSITGNREVTIVWLGSDEPDLAGYLVYRSRQLSGPYDVIAEITVDDLPLSLEYTDGPLTNGETYYYAVASFDYADNLSELSYEEVFDTPRPDGYGVRLYAREVQPERSAFDFRRQARLPDSDTRADIVISLDNGVLFVEAVNVDTDIQDFGFTETIDDLDWAPQEGWSAVGWTELILGHTYVIWTDDDHYAKFRVTGMNTTSIMMNWAYQVDPGNPELKPAVDPRTMSVTGNRSRS